jgi:hypothetical protein
MNPHSDLPFVYWDFINQRRLDDAAGCLELRR